MRKIPKWKKLEHEVSKDILGRLSIASGSKPIDKSDVNNNKLYIECKSTYKSVYRLKRSDLIQLFRRALINHKTPVFIVRLEDDTTKDYIAIIIDNYVEDGVIQKSTLISINTSIERVQEIVQDILGIEATVYNRQDFIEWTMVDHD